MTVHLYYGDSYLAEFSAMALEERQIEGQPALILDRTAFYPNSGGQPHDTGILGTARVLKVEEEPSGAILHFLDSRIAPGPVNGRIDWQRRFDHMQQHTGQHVLSQAFIQIANSGTVSFHLGQEICTIDLEMPQPDDVLMTQAEALASRIVFENRSVRVLNVQRTDLATLGVRRESQRDGDIRVVEIEDFDRSPCGGTHVRCTGEIGVIAVLGYERYKGGTRVEFACGWRALKTLRKDHDTLKALGRRYSAHPYEVVRLTEKLLEERSALTRENLRLQNEILGFEAEQLIERASKVQGVVVVRQNVENRNLESLKLLAQKIAVHPGSIAILGSLQETAVAVAAKSKDLPGHCGAAVKRVSATLGGRGGGNSELAQAGGIPAASLEAWLQALEEALLSRSD
jgi:alanyl-tRNA synthetase